jgi:GT2 family glycosyltransferase
MPRAERAQPRLSLVVLNWNGIADTLECLTSLRSSTLPIHAVVVDNGSTGGEAERIRASGLADTVIETGENLGYAEGNNIGLRHVLAMSPAAEFVGVLNNDTAADLGCFEGLIERLGGPESPPRALAPTTFYSGESEKVWFAGGVIDRGWPRHLQPAELETRPADVEPSEWLSGCCIVARASTWRSVGLFDPRYFLIFEDCEWSLRAHRQGVELGVATSCRLRHKVSRSFSSGPSSLLGSYYFIRNGLLFDVEYRREDLMKFAADHLLRPTASDLIRLRVRRGLAFRWLGAAAFVARQSGRAPRAVTHLAAHGSR